MENSVEMVEEVAGLGNSNVIKVAAVVLGIGAIIGIGYAIKKHIDNKKVIRLGPTETKEIPENEIQ